MSYLQNNAAVNYTLYYNVIEYFKTIMLNHPTIQSVTQGDIAEIDDEQFQLYPLGNVNILGANFNTNTTDYTIQLIIADKIKNKNNESVGRTNAFDVPFYKTDDTIDIWANTLGVVNDLVSYTKYKVESFDVFQDVQCIPFRDNFDNGLAGWVCNFVAVTHNDRNRCLFDLDGTC